MKLTLETPVKLRISEFTEVEFSGLSNVLKYKDNAVEQLLRRTKKSFFLLQRMGEERFHEHVQEIEKGLWKSLLFNDDIGFYTLPGMVEKLRFHYPDLVYENQVIYPEFQLIPWAKVPEFDPYDYQSDSVAALVANPHSHIELATGTGKSFVATLLVKETGLPTIISTPSIGLAKSMYKELCERFGKRKVGMLGGSRKDYGKDILVAVGKSLSMVKPQDFHKFSKYQVLISDESHTLPANQFNYFIHEVLGHIPYRWFLSATQERNDGKDLLLEGIINKCVHTLTIQEAMEKGYLAKIKSVVFDVDSQSNYQNSNNVVKMNQQHFYGNQNILNIIASIVPDALAKGIPTIILVDEHRQEELIRSRIGEVYAYARGGTDTDRICQDFNAGKIMCVVGTSAVSTGTNFKPVRLTINWQGGKAETKFKQGVIGRSTRIDKESGKNECQIVDFRVRNVPMQCRHANARIKLYKAIGPIEIVDYQP